MAAFSVTRLPESPAAAGRSLTSVTRITNDCSKALPMASVERTRIESRGLAS